MKQVSLTLTCALVAIVAFSATADAVPIVFDFESEATTSGGGALGSLVMTESGVTATITRPTSAFDITDLSSFSVDPSFGARTLDPFSDTSATPFIIDFSTALSSASIDWGDFGGDSPETILLEAFSGLGASGALLATDMFSIATPSGSFTFDTAMVAAAGIRSLRLIGGSDAFPHSVYYDNLTVETETAAVPEPGSAALLLCCSAGFFARRRRRKASVTSA